MSKIRSDIFKFKELTGLSDHRVGMLLAKNGMIVSRLRNGGRIFEDTREQIEKRLASEVEARGLNPRDFACLRSFDGERQTIHGAAK